MTLMLRPQVWSEMYRQSPAGVQFNTTDPTLWPRWFFFIFGSFPAAGVGLMLLAQRAHFEAGLKRFLYRAGGVALAAGLVLQLALAKMALAAQPDDIVAKVMQNSTYILCSYAWIATAALGVAIAIWATLSAPNKIAATAAALLIFLNIAATVMVRDGIRDVTLRAAGFEVRDRQVVTNWSVVGLFVVLLLAAIGAVIYLIRVVAKARLIEEKYA